MAENLEKDLDSVFHRGFWHGGYYLGQRTGEWSGAYGSRSSMEKVFVGRVINMFNRIGIAHIMVENESLYTNDTLFITGPTTGYCEITAASLRVDDHPVTQVKKGQTFTLPVPVTVRKQDKVYKVRKRQKWQE